MQHNIGISYKHTKYRADRIICSKQRKPDPSHIYMRFLGDDERTHPTDGINKLC